MYKKEKSGIKHDVKKKKKKERNANNRRDKRQYRNVP
jgi:hypothetical protein